MHLPPAPDTARRRCGLRALRFGGDHAVTRIRLIPPASDRFAPKGRRGVPVPLDLAQHSPVMPYGDDGDFAERLGEVHRAAAAVVHNPLRDVALAVQALSYAEKIELATALRSSVGAPQRVDGTDARGAVMKAISLWQPWASLIACGAKPFETRHWAPPRELIGQSIAIHAAKKIDKGAAAFAEELMY